MKIFLSPIYLFSTLLLSTITIGCKTTTASLNQQESIFFYVGTNSGDPLEGIYTYALNTSDGTSKFLSKYPNILNPGYLTINGQGDKLYAVHSVEGEKQSAVSAFDINKRSGELQFLNRQSTEGRGGCHVSASTQGDVVVANYSSGSVSYLPTHTDGKLASASSTVAHSGSSINKERQEGPHAHFIQEGIGGLFYAVDLGIDKIMLYKNVNDELVTNDPPFIPIHPGAGPRHLDFHPNGNFVYVLNELEGSVTALKYNGNNKPFEKLQTVSSLPEGFTGFNKSADIHIHPSGKFLYASNRGDHNSIAVYKVDTTTGSLSLIEIEIEAIAWPRNFAISPDGNYLLCANRDSDSITIYKINKSTGTLIFTGQKVSAPKPICVKFSK